MTKPTSLVLALIAILASIGMAQQADRKTFRTIKATVVAENVSNRFQGCWHVCGMSLVVKLEGSNSPEFALISVTYMDDRGLDKKGPHWKLVEKTGKWEFNAVLDDPPVVELKKFATTYDLTTRKETTDQVQMNQWILLKGSEHVQLPFGRSISSYSVDVSRFKSIK